MTLRMAKMSKITMFKLYYVKSYILFMFFPFFLPHLGSSILKVSNRGEKKKRKKKRYEIRSFQSTLIFLSAKKKTERNY